jgi:hypothetical protein
MVKQLIIKQIEFLGHLNELQWVVIFSSPELKTQVSFFDQLLSVQRLREFRIFQIKGQVLFKGEIFTKIG